MIKKTLVVTKRKKPTLKVTLNKVAKPKARGKYA